jgi:hypothetical protein
MNCDIPTFKGFLSLTITNTVSSSGLRMDPQVSKDDGPLDRAVTDVLVGWVS